jgi:hypothetical protein
MNDFAHVQTEMQASIDSQTSMMHDISVILGLTLVLKSCKDLSLQRFKLGGGAGCPGMSLHLSHFIPGFSSYPVTCLAHITTIIMTARKYCFP